MLARTSPYHADRIMVDCDIVPSCNGPIWQSGWVCVAPAESGNRMRVGRTLATPGLSVLTDSGGVIGRGDVAVEVVGAAAADADGAGRSSSVV